MSGATLAVDTSTMRGTAAGLDGVAIEFRGDDAGFAMIGAAGGMGGLAIGGACISVGGALRDEARRLGDDVDGYAGKLRAAAERYDRRDYEAAESIDFTGPAEASVDRAYPPVDEYERRLREAGLLDGPVDGYYKQWLQNASRQGVPPETIVDIARTHGVRPDGFAVLDGMTAVKDPDGKTYVIMPPGTSAADMRKAALMTYVLNAGTDYGEASADNDFEEMPYSAGEVQRIIDRQGDNSWSYQALARAGGGGSFAATPNGMVMGLGGTLADRVGVQGGTTYGDAFVMNIDGAKDPAKSLDAIIRSGQGWYQDAPAQVPTPGTLDLDRLLHHEERHSQQWAEKGFTQMAKDYGLGWIIERNTGHNPLEQDAGLSDGGYR